MVQTRSHAKKSKTYTKRKKGAQLPSKKRPPVDSDSVTAPVKKRRRGKPGEICQLNLDVLFLIAAYVHPIDLLNLARTCKSLRHLLMDKCATFVWKTARQQAEGLPDCPVDLTEPEFANLAFCACCHGCGKYAKNVFWGMRRRYCLDCRVAYLCSLPSCDEVVRKNKVLATEHISVEGETSVWVDREQMKLFMSGYRHSSDKKHFLCDKQEQHKAVCAHARQCEKWTEHRESMRKDDLKVRRGKRDDSIFERLKQVGYEHEIRHFSRPEIQRACKVLFGKSKPLTDREWNRIWPGCIGIMDNFRSRRLNEAVYTPRRRSLRAEYAEYLASPPLSVQALDLLPHAIDIINFPMFKDIIRAPEDMDDTNLFQSAFVQLPELVNEWKQKLDVQVADLIEIPPHMSSKGSNATNSSTHSSQATTDKLLLACALFTAGFSGCVFTYPEILYYPRYPRDEDRSAWDQYDIQFVKAAPYIVHACGLDPNVATADDMNRLDPWFTCPSCKSSSVQRWRDAILHTLLYHKGRPESMLKVRLNKQVARTHAVESTFENQGGPRMSRCLLCLPSVGYALQNYELDHHMRRNHKLGGSNYQVGVHYLPFG